MSVMALHKHSSHISHMLNSTMLLTQERDSYGYSTSLHDTFKLHKVNKMTKMSFLWPFVFKPADKADGRRSQGRNLGRVLKIYFFLLSEDIWSDASTTQFLVVLK